MERITAIKARSGSDYSKSQTRTGAKVLLRAFWCPGQRTSVVAGVARDRPMNADGAVPGF